MNLYFEFFPLFSVLYKICIFTGVIPDVNVCSEEVKNAMYRINKKFLSMVVKKSKTVNTRSMKDLSMFRRQKLMQESNLIIRFDRSTRKKCIHLTQKSISKSYVEENFKKIVSESLPSCIL